jgi:hypothetical protein
MHVYEKRSSCSTPIRDEDVCVEKIFVFEPTNIDKVTDIEKILNKYRVDFIRVGKHSEFGIREEDFGSLINHIVDFIRTGIVRENQKFCISDVNEFVKREKNM